MSAKIVHPRILHLHPLGSQVVTVYNRGMSEFETTYKLLNPSQRLAVDTVDGPVLVVAGPGTGKTQLLSMRVANILRKTDVDPGNILCLTFTNKAAVNMRERLITLTGGEASGVMVKTFHSFAAELMNMYPDHFWNGAKLSTAPDATQIEIIQDILGRLPLNNPLALRFAGNFTAGKDVKNALKYVKEAGLTPEKLKALITANLAYIDTIEADLVEILAKPLSVKNLANIAEQVETLPEQGIGNSLQPLQDLGHTIKESLRFALQQDEGTGKTKHTGKWKQRWVQSVESKKGMHKERERNEWWFNLADVYASYRNSLHLRGYYDYSDMIVEVISQLQNNADMRGDAQERFLYVLIDEFQDTNAAQLQLAHLIADHPSSNGKPNLMVVGDDDQSIYKFNGAELNNMLSFQSSYPAAKLVVLTENYRSSQKILDMSTKIIDQVSDRLVTRMPSLSKDLIAKNIPSNSGTIEHRSYATEDHELSGIADDIATLYKQQNSENHDSIAVLARDHASLRRIASLLDSREVAVRYEQQSNVLEHPVVQQIHYIASALVAIQDGDAAQLDVLLSKIIRGPMWQLKPSQLWAIATSVKRTTNWLDTMLASNDDRLAEIAHWLLWLSQQASNEPLSVILEYIIGLRASSEITSPLREYYLAHTAADTDYLQSLSALRLLQSMANDFARSTSARLQEFVQFIQLSIDSGEIIADETIFVSGPNAVELLTVHKSKGLEFGTVFVINAVDGSWKPGTGGRKCPANLPLQPAGDDIDDYARLMYVAATRAKHTLIAASYREDITSKEVLATPLIHEAIPRRDISAEITTPSVSILEEHLHWPHLNLTDEKRNLSAQLDNFALSASSLLDFLDVSKGGPELFFERHLLRLPEAQSTSMAFGIAIHAALEYAQITVNGTGLQIDKILSHYETSLANQFLPKHEHLRFLEHGKELLHKLLTSESFWLGKGGIPEQSMGDIRVGNAQLKGTLDRININDEGLIIIDYKTGKPLGSFVTRDQTKAIKAWRHRMQLVFYALLVSRSSRFKAKSITGQMWYVEAASAKELIREYIPSAAELERMSQLVQVVWSKITELNLPNVTNYSQDYTGIQAFEQDLLDGRV